ncbi:hypothetical protein CM240_3054 [Clostridium bornimense]|uniref:Uncharacterized protein n=1 Tax=Clostridium bornimense TaxID=1216932 RepID=W6RZT5_9CLOT|nr:hypothetical protein CM240_3054 [Clostridium bornimense]
MFNLIEAVIATNSNLILYDYSLSQSQLDLF